ncbi:MAG: VCBS repeat-containing protein [Deltaproteobacteria bacterium]|nr:VCBS repeat-containing protein [Deltaproteobacteria bacterium]
MSGRLSYSSIFWVPALLFLSACGGEDAATCLDDRSCGAGQRCVTARFGEPGSCEPCAATETPYDGVDNDCSARTPDLDLDGDGDNWDQAPNKPGRDCDDDDSAVGINKAEVCGDGKDNDCDRTVDEPDCADREPPTVTIISPAAGALISGQMTIQVAVSDDVGVTSVDLLLNGAPLESQNFTPPTIAQTVTVTRDSRTLSDGRVVLEAVATDIKGLTTRGQVTIDIDNMTGPEIVFQRPSAAGRAYGGTMMLAADINDPSGVGAVELELDGVPTQSFASPPYQMMIDTRTMSEGEHRVLFRATDLGPEVTTTSELTFMVDNTEPVVVIDDPVANAMLTGPVNASVRATDANGIQLITMAGTTGASPLNFVLNSALLPNGVYTLTATAADTAEVSGGGGNVGSTSVSVRVQNTGTGPVVAITAPLNGEEVFGLTTVNVTAAATSGTIQEVRFFLDGQLLATDGVNPYTVVMDLTGLTGEHEIRADAVAGPSTGSASVRVTAVQGPSFRTAQLVTATGIDASNYDIADLNGDSIPDLVMAGSQQKIVLGDTNLGGRWRAGRSIPLGGGSAADIRVVNIDGTGQVIVVMLNQSIVIYRYTEPGVVTRIYDSGSIGNGFTWMDVGDIDMDGDQDLAIGSGVSPVTILTWNNGAYTATQVIAGAGNAAQIKLFDVDQDQDLDVVVGRTGGGANNVLSVYPNDGTGTFGASRDTATPGQPERFDIGDLDGDGYDDILVLMGNFSVLTGNPATPGAYTLGPVYRTGAPGGRGVLIHDFDGDGRNDWLLAQPTMSGAEIFRNPPGGATPERLSGLLLCDGFRRPRLYDLNRDGEVDLIGSCPGGAIAVSYGLPGGGFFAAPLTLLPSNGTRSFQLLDLNGAAPSELLVGGDTPHAIYVMERSGAEWEIATTSPTPAPMNSLAAGDFDASPGIELIGGTVNAGVFRLLQVTPMSFSASLLPFAGTFGTIGNVVGDPSPEIIIAVDAQGTSMDRVDVYPLALGTPLSSITLPAPAQVLVGNFDSDVGNTPELGLLSTTLSNLTVATPAGVGWTTAAFGLVAGASAFALEDINNDGRMDLVAGGSSSLGILLGDAATTFAAPVVFQTGSAVVKIAKGDFNQDGRIDLAATQSNKRLAIYMARSNGGYFPPLLLPTTAEPKALFVSDLNGDGNDDLVVGHTAGIPAVGTYLSETF